MEVAPEHGKRVASINTATSSATLPVTSTGKGRNGCFGVARQPSSASLFILAYSHKSVSALRSCTSSPTRAALELHRTP